ncbi:MAG: hypothetical protein E5X61_28880 [Mesorhizobium sp.]|nr:MAG: hypothetical protein E5X61_28880 [Mesorhizobium sp.]
MVFSIATKLLPPGGTVRDAGTLSLRGGSAVVQCMDDYAKSIRGRLYGIFCVHMGTKHINHAAMFKYRLFILLMPCTLMHTIPRHIKGHCHAIIRQLLRNFVSISNPGAKLSIAD